MRKTLLTTLAAVAAFAIAPAASATTFLVGSPNFTSTPGPNGTYSGDFGNSGIAAGTNLSDSFLFTLPANGFGSGSVTTSSSVLFSPTDLDFLSVTINGTPATLTSLAGGLYEAAFASMVPITAGVQNNLTVNYTSRGSGAYGGQLSFVPASAVPEPAAWAMMILGMGAVGFAMRRKQKVQTNVSFA